MKLQVKGVYKSYDSPTLQGPRYYVLQGIDLEVQESEFVCLLGHTGCGKSTLLNLIAGYIKPDRGEITVDGEPIHGPSADRGVVFQEYALFPWYTVLENVAFGPEVRGKSKAEATVLARLYITLVGLKGFENYLPDSLSGGMKQRVGIARALANKPSILLMDEPFGALDALTRETMRKELLRIWLEVKPTVIFVTHSVPEAVYLADRIALMAARPGTIKAIIKVDLPRPRDTHHQKFLDYVQEIENFLAGEASLEIRNE